MQEVKTRRPSLSVYFTLGIIIVSTVLVVAFLQANYSYTSAKREIIKELKRNEELSLNQLQQNISGLISSYAINEYDKLVFSELKKGTSFAIVIHDYNMGKILGQPAYISGKVRSVTNDIVDFNPDDIAQQTRLKQSYSSSQKAITSTTGETLGQIYIYTSDTLLNQKLNEIISNTISNVLTISLLLVITLFLFIRAYILRPLSNIVKVISNCDDDGIPQQQIPHHGPQEVLTLSDKMNEMITSIKDSRQEMKAQHQYLQSIIDGIDDPIMVINDDYSIKLMNNATKVAGEGLSPIDQRNPKCFELSNHCTSPCDKDIPCPLQEVMKTHTRCSVIHQHEMDGEKQYTELSATPLFNEDGSCTGIIETARDITSHLKVQDELREQSRALDFLAHHDPLTGLANRTLFNEHLEQGIEKAKRNCSQLAVLFIDLDHFKEINDSLGHKMGDKVLNIVSQRLTRTVRKNDTLARLGGDEFIIMLEDITQDSDASILAEKVLKVLARTISIEGKDLYVGSSIGISLYPSNGKTAQDLLMNADAAMYKAKKEGRNNFQYYDAEMTRKAMERVSMEAHLRAALKNDEFEVYYQPQVDGRDGRIIGFEALVRWNSPELGFISPGKFIPIAESTGLIVPLDQLVMKKAMHQVTAWYSEGLNPGRLSMNLAIKQLQHKGFISTLKRLIKETGCSPDWLELEVTEGELMTKPEENIKVLNQVCDYGIKMALDDFGTGYSSLSYLKKLPISKLKIDQSFIRELPHGEEDISITKAVIALAKSLNLDLIAEGTETDAQLTFLLQNGCHNIQGFLYARPMPAAEVTSILAEGVIIPNASSLPSGTSPSNAPPARHH